jgi:predicted DCC family thiol-disulfide oxidoreductase YuxK
VPLEQRDLIFYDGSCGLCHRLVRFAFRRDLAGTRFEYAPLGGATFTTRFSPERRASFPDSVVIQTFDGRVLVKSDAALHLAERVGGGWGTLARLASVLPRWLLDWGYDGMAASRRWLFERPSDTCPVPPAETRSRFLP